MDDPLITYLQDHLAGASHGIELAEGIRDRHSEDPLGQVASELLSEIKQDRETLLSVAERLGASSSGVKNTAAWVSEKLSRLKLRERHSHVLGTFESLELLQLGIHGKWAMWRALAEVAQCDWRLNGIDFDQLTVRALAQQARVDECRLKVAQTALRLESSPNASPLSTSDPVQRIGSPDACDDKNLAEDHSKGR